MIVVQHILPSLRVAITRELIERHGLKKIQVAKKMNMTPAAITQYLNKSRGEKSGSLLEGSEKVREIVSEITDDIVSGEMPVDRILFKLCLACREIRMERILCELHIDAMPSLGKIESCACSLGLLGWNQELR